MDTRPFSPIFSNGPGYEAKLRLAPSDDHHLSSKIYFWVWFPIPNLFVLNSQFTTFCIPNVNFLILLHFAFWFQLSIFLPFCVLHFGFQLSIFLPFCVMHFGFHLSIFLSFYILHFGFQLSIFLPFRPTVFCILDSNLPSLKLYSCKPLWTFSVDNATPLPPTLICSPSPVHIACEPCSL